TYARNGECLVIVWLRYNKVCDGDGERGVFVDFNRYLTGDVRRVGNRVYCNNKVEDLALCFTVRHSDWDGQTSTVVGIGRNNITRPHRVIRPIADAGDCER